MQELNTDKRFLCTICVCIMKDLDNDPKHKHPWIIFLPISQCTHCHRCEIIFRQQERHLGINNRTKRDSQVTEKPVNVYIHDIAKTPSNGVENIEVLYHVSVSGKPVPAITAAADMGLVSDEEVVTELGYPFVIKAERRFNIYWAWILCILL